MEAAAAEQRWTISKSRLECLFDGIFAIAMTLLVLDLKVPELVDRHSVAELARALAHQGPTFFSYLLSFFVLGLLWFRHNRYYPHLLHITPAMLALHLVQLAAAAFFPYSAALLGRQPVNAFTLVVYTGCIFLYTLAATGVWMLAERAAAISPQLGAPARERLRRRHLRSSAKVGLLFVLCLVNAFLR